jgi:hypothetical protein
MTKFNLIQGLKISLVDSLNSLYDEIINEKIMIEFSVDSQIFIDYLNPIENELIGGRVLKVDKDGVEIFDYANDNILVIPFDLLTIDNKFIVMEYITKI